MDDITVSPSNEAAEQGIIGAILFKPESIVNIIPWVKEPEVFYYDKNRKIWRIFLELHNARVPIDPVTVMNKANEVYGEGEIPPMYLAQSMQSIASAENIGAYGEIIYTKYLQRKIADRSDAIKKSAQKKYEGFDDAVSELSRMIQEFQHIRPEIGMSIEEITLDTIKKIQTKENIIEFNNPILDSIAGGMTRKELTVLGGRPSHGKTTLMINIAMDLVKSGKKVMILNREMSNEEMTKKIITMLSGKLSYRKIRKGDLNEDSYEEIERVSNLIKSEYYNLMLYDDIRDMPTALNEIRRKKPDIVFDDYIQLISPLRDRERRRHEIEDILYEYKWLAKIEKIPIFLISQLSREIEKRIDPRPKMSDFAESGVIEQVTETCLFTFREYVFNPQEANPYESEVIAAKARYGVIDAYTIGFNGDKCKYYPTVREAEENK